MKTIKYLIAVAICCIVLLPFSGCNLRADMDYNIIFNSLGGHQDSNLFMDWEAWDNYNSTVLGAYYDSSLNEIDENFFTANDLLVLTVNVSSDEKIEGLDRITYDTLNNVLSPVFKIYSNKAHNMDLMTNMYFISIDKNIINETTEINLRIINTSNRSRDSHYHQRL